MKYTSLQVERSGFNSLSTGGDGENTRSYQDLGMVHIVTCDDPDITV